jgi:type I restriction enzyme R subunit
VGLGEADTRAKPIGPALHARGWTEDLIRREETAGSVESMGGQPRKCSRDRVNCALRVRVSPSSKPIAMTRRANRRINALPAVLLRRVFSWGLRNSACKTPKALKESGQFL